LKMCDHTHQDQLEKPKGTARLRPAAVRPPHLTLYAPCLLTYPLPYDPSDAPLSPTLIIFTESELLWPHRRRRRLRAEHRKFSAHPSRACEYSTSSPFMRASVRFFQKLLTAFCLRSPGGFASPGGSGCFPVDYKHYWVDGTAPYTHQKGVTPGGRKT
jgi:hypothetical protein